MSKKDGNLLRWLREFESETGQPIEAVCVGAFDGETWKGNVGERAVPDSIYMRPVSLAEAAPHIDYDFDDGYGLMDCHDLTAWTKDWVVWVHEYDGSTCLASVRRNPREESEAA